MKKKKSVSTLSGFNSVEVKFDDKFSLEILSKFYNGIFIENFPNPNERDSLENILNYLKVNSGNSSYSKIKIYYNNDEIIGGIIYDMFPTIKTLAIEFIVVNKHLAGNGLASNMLNDTITKLMNEYRQNLEWLIIEIDVPSSKSDYDLSYLYFWKKHGMKVVDFKYIQPALDKNKSEVTDLVLCAKNLNNDVYNTIPKVIIKDFIYLYSRHAIQIIDPLEDTSVKKMYLELEKSSERLALNNLDILINPINCTK